jgi:hypothetical protein
MRYVVSFFAAALIGMMLFGSLAIISPSSAQQRPCNPAFEQCD